MNREVVFSRQLKKIRKQKGYTQVKLAEALGCSKGSVTMWESGTRYPEFPRLIELANLLEVSLDCLIFGTETVVITEQVVEKYDADLLDAAISILTKMKEEVQ